MADKEWVKVYATDQAHKAGIVKAYLEDNQIKTVEVNKKDSSYTFIGDIELYTSSDDALLATALIKANEL